MPENLSIGEALDEGTGFAMAGNHTSAKALFRGVLIHEPENFEAILRLGSSLFEEKNYYEALYWFWRGRKIDRRHPLALTNYGLCLGQLGHTAEGLPDLERAVRIAEKSETLSPQAKGLIYNNLGNSLERVKRYDEALVALDKGIEYNANDAFPHYNRGIVLLRLNRHREAIAALTRSLELRHDNNADALYNRAMGYLLLGDLERGFADYEGRLLTTENDTPNLGLPADKKWTGDQDIAGKTILIHAEQGLGDAIQFMRFVPMIRDRCAKTLFVVHSALREMAKTIEGVELLPPMTNTEGMYDYWVALMSIPWCLRIKHENELPPPWNYEPEPERIVAWHKRLNLPQETLNVGVCWAGNFRHKNNLHRSIPLETFTALFEVSDCTFVSLQQMQACDTEVFAECKARYSNLTALWLEDFRDTAAVMENLDLVISADTAVAHLAGSMGIPTWIPIPKFGTDWRWQLERGDSPWYPDAKLYRQTAIGDWKPTMMRMQRDLIAKTTALAA